jgi:hypothetical protein
MTPETDPTLSFGTFGTTSVHLESGNFDGSPRKRHQRSHLVSLPTCLQAGGQGFESPHVHQNRFRSLKDSESQHL